MAGFFDSLFGSAPKLQQLERFKPQQQQLQNQAINAFNPLLQNVTQPTDISGITGQARRQFNTETIPSLAERFRGLGSYSPEMSSNFTGALGGAGAGLESSLASLESQVGLQDKGRQQQLLGLLANLGMQPSFEYYRDQGQPGFFGTAQQPAINALSSLLPFGQFLPLLLSLFGGSGPQAQIGMQQN